MPIRHRLAAATGVVAIAAAIALAGSAPASAHSGQFFTLAKFGDGYAFATISQADATVVGLPTPLAQAAAAVEIWNEVGYAIGNVGQFTDTLYFWDHTTGAITGDKPITLDPAFPAQTPVLQGVFALDTTKGSSVPDGTILTFARINTGGEINQGTWLSSIDPATGVLTPLVDVTGLEADTYVDSLATDPVTGVTYALVDYNNGVPQYAPINIAAKTVGAPVALTAARNSLDYGYMGAADFTNEGLLYFFHSSGRFAHLTGSITSDPSAVAIGPISNVSERALAYDPAPQLAETGLNLVNPAIAALALLGFGAAVVVVSRRRVTAA
jgi:hypothetical protein